jgi:hypothetical protein
MIIFRIIITLFGAVVLIGCVSVRKQYEGLYVRIGFYVFAILAAVSVVGAWVI